MFINEQYDHGIDSVFMAEMFDLSFHKDFDKDMYFYVLGLCSIIND